MPSKVRIALLGKLAVVAAIGLGYCTMGCDHDHDDDSGRHAGWHDNGYDNGGHHYDHDRYDHDWH